MPSRYAAFPHSGYFRRTIGAFEQRAPELLERLPRLVDAPLDASTVEALWSTVSAGLDPQADPGPALRRTRQLLMLAIIERDVSQRAPLDEICAAISCWAELSIRIERHAVR
ncbi:MAG TPA: hypothetical protein VM491_02050, partial [Burkholderiaceae bacterium]|nr:hypothetical protein [Burkholderiaceae bacterium]